MTAKIKLNAASGGGSFSLQAPSSSSNNRVISLPDIADGTLLTSQSSLDSTKLSPAISAGIAMHDVWQVTAQLSVGSGDSAITANWARADALNGVIGSAMTQSSGVFTFPSTGIYLVTINGNYEESGSGGHNYAGFYLKKTTNNSSYTTASFGAANIAALGGGTFGFASASFTFDVTDVSTHKIRFHTITSGAGMTLAGASSYNTFWAEFTRLGDT